MKFFKLTPDHMKLLAHMNVDWAGDKYWGAPCIDVKRPYGDGDIEESIARILGWKLFVDQHEEEHLSPEQSETARKLHTEMARALVIVLRAGWVEPGLYEADDYSSDWRKSEETQKKDGHVTL